jgi:folylpolyglutamate synthase/dihydropteroate synthase
MPHIFGRRCLLVANTRTMVSRRTNLSFYAYLVLDPQTRLLEDYTRVWSESYGKFDEVKTSGTAFDAFESVREASHKRHILVSGSLHLVGLALDYLATQKRN